MAEEERPASPRPAEGPGATSRLLGELLAQGTPVAEIAVRLGISVQDAHARIAREAGGGEGAPLPQAARPLPPSLAGSAPPPVAGASPPPGPPASGGIRPPARQPRAPAPRRGLSRRALLALATAGVAGLATGGAFLATREGGEPETAARPPRPIPVPPTLTPTPPPLAALRPATGVFRELAYEPGQPLTAAHGIFFMGARGEGAGAVAGWQLAEPEGAEPPAYRVGAGGRFVAAGGALHDRVSGQSWTWPEERLRLAGFSDEAALFEQLDPEAEPSRVKQARYVLTDGALEERAVFELTGMALPAAPPFFEPGGRRAFIALEQPGRYPALFMLDGATAHAAIVLGPAPQGSLRRALFHAATPASDGESFLMPYSYFPTRPPRALGYGILATFVARLGWEGEHRTITRVRVDRAFVSPDGSLVAGERVLPLPGREPEDYEETSTVMVIDGRTGRNRFRVRSARLNYGDELGGGRWLADSSGLVVQSRIGGKTGYSLVSADGTRMERLPDPPRRSGEWFEHHDVRGAAPSPADPSLIAFGRTDVYDRAADRWLAATPTEAAPAHVGPWALTGGDEAVLALPHQPHRVYPLLASLDETHIERNLPSGSDDA